MVRVAVGIWVFVGGGRWSCSRACTSGFLWVWLVAAGVVTVSFVVALRSVVVGSMLAVFLFLAGVAVLALGGGPVDVIGACSTWEG